MDWSDVIYAMTCFIGGAAFGYLIGRLEDLQ
jgi:hypothetical protein